MAEKAEMSCKEKRGKKRVGHVADAEGRFIYLLLFLAAYCAV